jgi:3-hydroxypropanoate dehydrogenase
LVQGPLLLATASESPRLNITTDQLFTQARTQNGYLDQPVPDAQLQQLYELLKWGPTSANASPARFVFVRTPEAKAKLAACVSPANQPKVMSAPVTAIIGMDMAFYEQLPTLFPHTDARAWFLGNDALIASTAMRNSSLQGGYLIMAARALGLGCGPMSGMDTAKVDAAFFAGTTVKTNFVCTLGHGDPAKVMARSPRLAFEQACQLV